MYNFKYFIHYIYERIDSMNIDIRKHIKNNFKGAKKDEIKSSIISSIDENEEVTLPGLGVFFEILWMSSDDNEREFILNNLEENLK